MTRVFQERVDGADTQGGVYKEHLATYRFARRHVEGKSVLDVGCGTGYGSAYLAQAARQVTGIDISPEAVARAHRSQSAPGLSFRAMDALRMDFGDQTFEAAVCFEMIEHITEHDPLMREIRRVLVPGGLLVAATPNKRFSTGENPYHVRELFPEEFEALLRAHFTSVQLFGQGHSSTIGDVYQGSPFKRFLARLDFLRLRDRVDWGLKARFYRLVGFKTEADISLDDYRISDQDPDQAQILIGLCVR